MSPRILAEQAERDKAENEAAEKVTNAFLELVARKDQERREQAATYRELVMRAADGGGQLPQADIERLVNITRTLDLTVDDFSADVSAVYRDREHEDAIAALREQQRAVGRERDAAAAEEERLRQEWFPLRDEYDRRRREFDEQVSKVRQTRERADNAVDRFAREASKRGDRQSYDRHSHRRVWGPM